MCLNIREMSNRFCPSVYMQWLIFGLATIKWDEDSLVDTALTRPICLAVNRDFSFLTWTQAIWCMGEFVAGQMVACWRAEHDSSARLRSRNLGSRKDTETDGQDIFPGHDLQRS